LAEKYLEKIRKEVAVIARIRAIPRTLKAIRF
jgi:hypothetical protein